MKTFINGLQYLNLFFASIGAAIFLRQISRFFPDLLPYFIFFWMFGGFLAIVLWIRASINDRPAWLPAIFSICATVLLIDEVRLLWF
jgi:hypothetical protein